MATAVEVAEQAGDLNATEVGKDNCPLVQKLEGIKKKWINNIQCNSQCI